MVVYRATAKRRLEQEERELAVRPERAWGIGTDDTFRAVGAVMNLGEDIEINLVVMGACRATLRAMIEREGQEI